MTKVCTTLLLLHNNKRDSLLLGLGGRLGGLARLGVVLNLLGGTPVELLGNLGELAGNVGGVAVKHRGVPSRDLARVLHDDDLGHEVDGLLGGVVLGVGGDVATTDLLDGDVLDVEADVVTGGGLGHGLVVHLHRLDLSLEAGRGEAGNHARLDAASLDTAHGHCANATNLVDILEGKTEGLVDRALGGLGLVEGLKEGRTLVPGHVVLAWLWWWCWSLWLWGRWTYGYGYPGAAGAGYARYG